MAEALRRNLSGVGQEEKVQRGKKRASVLERAGQTVARRVREFKRELDEPIFPASATLRFPEGIDHVRASYLIKLGVLTDRGHIYRVTGSNDVASVTLDDAPQADLIDNLATGPAIELTPASIKHIIGDKPLATMDPKEASDQEAQLQQWIFKAITLSRDQLLIAVTPSGTFPTSMNGLDDAWNSLEIPEMQRTLPQPENPNFVRIEIPHPRWSQR